MFVRSKELLPPLDCRDRGFESRWRCKFSSLLFVVCCAGGGLWDKLISHSEECYRVRASNSVWSGNVNNEAA